MEVFLVSEDVKIEIVYVDEDGNYVDADTEPTITIKRSNKKCVDAVSMIHDSLGIYSYWWNSAGETKEVYNMEIAAEFSTYTDLTRSLLVLK